MNKNHNGNPPGYQNLWTNGLICAFEFCPSRRKINKYNTSVHQSANLPQINKDQFGVIGEEEHSRSFWRPIGWERISGLVKTVEVDSDRSLQNIAIDDEDEATVAELAVPYWERPLAGPTWWCHVDASHKGIVSWLRNAKWLHPAISVALRDESKLISERMKHIFYEVPVRVAGGLLFELLGQSAGDPFIEEDDIPIVLRSWHAQNFIVTALHVKGFASNISVLGITEVQEMLIAGGACIPRTVHELIAHLACRLARWDDRLFRKYIFGAADEVELMFMNKRMYEDLNLFTIILNQEIRRLSTQVIRVKWSLHAREEIVFELLQQLKGNTTKDLLEGIKKSTRDMINEQEAVRGRLFTIQDVMQNTVRAWLQDRSLTVTHNLGIFGGVGMLLTIVTGLFGINVDGIPGAQNSPQAFALFSAVLFFSGLVLVVAALLYLGLKEPKTEKNVEIRKLELDEMVKKFQREAESHAQVCKKDPHNIELAASSSRMIVHDPNGYVLIE
ncbi:unnamed protein product [Arabis nemorensis]|uniref:Magnesium transporter CorA-like family protein n=1 Tax=Arabis nemorensis TaxID=586526 RepID=A0A565BPD0_9BRAS|nr:unnamed protein product [Arabis nemorensis]